MKKGMSLLMNAVILLLVQTSLFAGEWSAYQGKMNWNDAKKKCASIGMRLPSIEEISAAFKAGETKSWTTDHHNYHTSYESGDGTNFYTVVSGGNHFTPKSNNAHAVRCIR